MFKISLAQNVETLAPLVNGMAKNTVPLLPTRQSDAVSNYLHPAFFSGRLMAELCSRFCSKLEVRAVRRPQI